MYAAPTVNSPTAPAAMPVVMLRQRAVQTAPSVPPESLTEELMPEPLQSPSPTAASRPSL